MRSIVETLLVDETLKHMPPEGGSGAYTNAHLERVAIRHLFGQRGADFADALMRAAEERRIRRS